MKLSRDKIERLTFVKYLHYQAGQQKNLERPLSSSAILTIHDCVECFLQLCFEVKTGKSKTSSQNILDTYSEGLNKVFNEEKQQQINKSYIKRINDLRNQLKHATIFTDTKQIPNLYTETELFLTDFTNQVFNIEFDKLSLIQLIREGDVKTYLLDSENHISKNELQKAMWSIGKAFYELENNLNRVEGKYGGNILSNHHDVDYLIKYTAQFGGSEPDSVLKENLKEIAKDVNRLQSEIYDLKTILSLSVGLKEYTHFKQHIPYVSKIIKGDTGKVEFWIPDEEREKMIEYDIKIVKQCMDFTIELALKIE
jgi:hypothetical protein